MDALVVIPLQQPLNQLPLHLEALQRYRVNLSDVALLAVDVWQVLIVPNPDFTRELILTEIWDYISGELAHMAYVGHTEANFQELLAVTAELLEVICTALDHHLRPLWMTTDCTAVERMFYKRLLGNDLVVLVEYCHLDQNHTGSKYCTLSPR